MKVEGVRTRGETSSLQAKLGKQDCGCPGGGVSKEDEERKRNYILSFSFGKI
jgi:hypothetical protein